MQKFQIGDTVQVRRWGRLYKNFIWTNYMWNGRKTIDLRGFCPETSVIVLEDNIITTRLVLTEKKIFYAKI